ncbi:MAG: TIGR02757 family protein [Treponema sp.]|nr:TIGR02757 family protein [Treponema sp.]
MRTGTAGAREGASRMTGMTKSRIGELLDIWYARVNRPEFIASDPVAFPRRFSSPCDIEIAAFLAAAIAWGRRDLVLRSAERMFALMGRSPCDYVMSGGWKKLSNRVVHRTFFEGDLKYYCRGLRLCYETYGSLEALFACHDGGGAGEGVWRGMSLFRDTAAKDNGGAFSRHIADPEARSACKRLNLALRWLVRKDAVDIGLWKAVNPSSLYIPLDVHAARTARRLGLLERTTGDKKAVLELTSRLREFSPEDPVKYDFALFGMGIYGRDPV